MTRMLTRVALYTLALVALVDMARYRRRELNRQTRREALAKWEDEGGSLPTPH
jgi:hypothetical protein